MMKKMLQPMLLLFANLAHLIRMDLIPPSPNTVGLARYGKNPINLNYSYTNVYVTMLLVDQAIVHLFSFLKSKLHP